MKRTQLKDALRNIWKQKVSYLSVIVIAFLGVATFLGMNYSDGALRINGSSMYNAVNYRDLEIISNDVFYQADLDAIREVEGVEDVEPVWQLYTKATQGNKSQDIAVISLAQRVNLPQLVEGRMPETAEECVVEQRLANDMGWHTGDVVNALNIKGETSKELLKHTRFTIVGFANHPDHISVSIPDTLYVMVQRDAFDMDALNNGFMGVEVVVKKPAGIDRFSQRYEAIVGAVSEKMEALGTQRASVRTEERHGAVQSRMDEAQEKLDEAQDQLQKARTELDQDWDKLTESDKQIDENEAKLADGQGQLMTSQAELMAGRDKLAEAEVKLAKAEVELSTGKTVLELSRTQLDNARQTLIDSWELKEDAVESIRNALRSGMGSAGNNIEWASRRKLNIDSSRVSAKDIYITTSFKLDLDKSLKANVRNMLDSGLLSDEEMIELYLLLKGGGQ